MPHIVHFTGSFVPEAAALLAARYRLDRSHAPALVARFAAVTAAQEVVQALWTREGTSGVVALQGSQLVGYVLGQVMRPAPASLAALFLQPRSLVMPYAGHALAPESPADLYRAMYAAAAPSWLAAGCFFHVITLPASDQGGLATWFSLSFGQRDVFAVRQTTPRASAAPSALGIHCRCGGATDQVAVRRLLTDLYRHSAGAPSWVPFLPDAVTGVLAEQERMLDDPGRAYWLAFREGQALGLHVVNLPDYPASVWDIGGPGPAPHVDMAVTAPAARPGHRHRPAQHRPCGGARGRSALVHGRLADDQSPGGPVLAAAGLSAPAHATRPLDRPAHPPPWPTTNIGLPT